MSTALLSLWERGDGRRLSLADYREMGGVGPRCSSSRRRRTPDSPSRSRAARDGSCCGWRRSTTRGSRSGAGCVRAELSVDTDPDARTALELLAATPTPHGLDDPRRGGPRGAAARVAAAARLARRRRGGASTAPAPRTGGGRVEERRRGSGRAVPRAAADGGRRVPGRPRRRPDGRGARLRPGEPGRRRRRRAGPATFDPQAPAWRRASRSSWSLPWARAGSRSTSATSRVASAVEADVRRCGAAALREERWDLALLYAAQAYQLDPSAESRPGCCAPCTAAPRRRRSTRPTGACWRWR